MTKDLDKTPERWFERFMPEWPEWPDVWGWLEERRPMMGGHPIKVEEHWGEDAIVVRAEAPGIDPDSDAEVTVSDGVLRIRVERRQEHTDERKGRSRSEFRYGSFTRSILLPPGAMEAEVSASYTKGILEVRVPLKREKAEAAKVPITKS